jgi:hypothetical protein
MAEKKKTEIVFGFEPHLLSSVDKMLPLMEKADVILLENTPQRVKNLLKGKQPSFADGYVLPEFAQKQIPLLQHLKKQGKVVLGSEPTHDEDWMLKNRKKARKIINLELDEKKLYFRGDFRGSIRAAAKGSKLIEQERLDWILKHLPQFEGKKIYIDIGEEHTGVYHKLKKELAARGIPVKTEFLSKGMFKDKRILVKYPPKTQLMRMMQFKTRNSRNSQVVKRLVEEDKQFDKKILGTVFGYMRRGMSEEQATEKAYLELINSEKSKIPPQRVRSMFRRKR